MRLLFENCYKNALRLAEENKISSIAYPAISPGAFGYPFQKAIDVSFSTILRKLEQIKHLQKIRFVLFSEQDFRFDEEDRRN